MKKYFQYEYVAVIIFIGILVLLLNPFHFWMPENVKYIMLASLLVLFGVYVSTVLKQQPQDEREEQHQFIAHRFGYLLGTALLMVGIIYEGITQYEIHPWLPIVLGVMVLANMCSLSYSRKNR